MDHRIGVEASREAIDPDREKSFRVAISGWDASHKLTAPMDGSFQIAISGWDASRKLTAPTEGSDRRKPRKEMTEGSHGRKWQKEVDGRKQKK